jgi:hypothetical protein
VTTVGGADAHPVYDPALSNTTMASPYNKTELSYGPGSPYTIQGTTGADYVCLYPWANTCVPDFSFFELLSSDFNGYDGTLGLAPASTDNGPSFTMALYNQGTLAEP